MRDISIQPLTQVAFAAFGDIISLKDAPDKLINQGLCGRHHDLAALDFGPDGRAGISLFDATPRSLPYRLELVERHPEGSQAFLPMTQNPFLVIVAPDEDGAPGQALGLSHRTRPRDQLAPQRLARCFDTFVRTRLICCRGPDRQ